MIGKCGHVWPAHPSQWPVLDGYAGRTKEAGRLHALVVRPVIPGKTRYETLYPLCGSVRSMDHSRDHPYIDSLVTDQATVDCGRCLMIVGKWMAKAIVVGELSASSEL